MTQISDTGADRLQKLFGELDLSETKYRLLQKLGSGGMAEVYLVHDTELDRQAALKVIDPLQFREDVSERMLKEAKVIAQLEHPAVVPVHDAGMLPDGRVYYVMKYVQGQRLDVYAAKCAATPDRLLIFLKICDAIAFAHSRGVLHRDLKPQNIMVGAFGEVQVMDWGLAKVFGSSWKGGHLDRNSEPNGSAQARGQDVGVPSAQQDGRVPTGTGMVLGTPGYMSPEQASGNISQINKQSDIYGLGAILYYLLTLRSPDNAVKPRQVNHKIARSLEAICCKAMALSQKDRYATAEELSSDVNSYVNGLPVKAYPENILEKSGRWLSRNSFFVYLLLAYLLMRAFLLIFARR